MAAPRPEALELYVWGQIGDAHGEGDRLRSLREVQGRADLERLCGDEDLRRTGGKVYVGK